MKSFKEFRKQRDSHFHWNEGDIHSTSLQEKKMAAGLYSVINSKYGETIYHNHPTKERQHDVHGPTRRRGTFHTKVGKEALSDANNRRFTPEHYTTMGDYKSESPVYNRPLRGDAHVWINSKTWKSQIHDLDHITSGTNKSHIIGYRSISTRLEPELHAGSLIKDNGFTGLSANRHTAKEFTNTAVDHRHVIAKIHVPAGSKGHYIDAHEGLSDHSHEQEYLLHRGTTFRVLGHTHDHNIHYVHMVVHHQEEHHGEGLDHLHYHDAEAPAPKTKQLYYKGVGMVDAPHDTPHKTVTGHTGEVFHIPASEAHHYPAVSVT